MTSLAFTEAASPMEGSDAKPTNNTSLWMSFAIIFVSEIGDKTFMIAVVMAMRYARSVILTASLGALGIMTVLSAGLGYALPNFISRRVTLFLSGVLFLIFGARMLIEARGMTGLEGKEELEEVEKEINEKELSEKSSLLEAGEAKQVTTPREGVHDGIKNLAHLMFSPIFIQTFIMVFLAEWGDRSQLATIALAGSYGFFWVSVGAVAGHAICTVMAVWGGQLLATKISVRTVTIVGGILFLIFGAVSLYEVHNFED